LRPAGRTEGSQGGGRHRRRRQARRRRRAPCQRERLVTAPVMERPPDPAPMGAETPAAGKERKGFRALTRNWSDLRSTPYGTKPMALSVFASLATGVTATAASYAGPQILEDLKINISSIISLRSVIGFFLTFAVIGLGWYADRHKRVPL